jgi:stress-induced morphogen
VVSLPYCDNCPAMMIARRFVATGVSREQRIHKMLTDALTPTQLLVEDLSGGCDGEFLLAFGLRPRLMPSGGTLRVTIESPKFQGKSVVQQHRLVNEALGTEMKNFHAAVIKTSATVRKD